MKQRPHPSLTLLAGAIVLATVDPAFAGATQKRSPLEAEPGTKTLTAEVSDPVHRKQNDVPVVEITNIQVEETADGIVVRLETEGELRIPGTAIAGNAVVAEIDNAVLMLAEGEDFIVSDPTAGIDRVSVSSLPNNRVRITILGVAGPPTVDIRADVSGIAVTATPIEEEIIDIVVTGEQIENDYFVPEATAGTRTDTPLRDIPQSIQVIPQQVIEDQQAIGLEEVLENAAGVTFLGNDDGRGFNFGIRGFNFVPVLRDGFVLSEFGADVAEPEVANLERVEVLRGPASVLYGQAEPGGVINLVTKQPLAEPYYNLQFQVGNRESISPSIDLSGPLTGDGRLRYRLNALYRHGESFRDFENDFDRVFVGPTLAWQISDRTDLTVSLEYTEDDEPLDFGTVAFGDGIADIPLERVVNTNPDNTIEQDYLNVGYTLEHRFSDHWQLRNQFRYTSSAYDQGVLPLPLSLDESTGILNRVFAAQSNETDTYSLYTNVQGEFNTGSIEHTLLLGVDLFRAEGEIITRFGRNFLAPINIFDPDYSTASTPSLESLDLIPGNSNTSTTDQLGIYLQDQIDILDNLILVGGLRYNTVDRETTDLVTDEETEQDYDDLIPRIGIVYQPVEPISLYANYSRSFAPNFFATDADGEPLEPEQGEGFEVGVRAELIDDRLAATLAYFDITKQNVATADPNDPFASVAVGEERSQGIDLYLTGEILPGWNVVASYAFIDAEVTEDNTDIVGNQLRGIPEHSASLWTTYEIQSGDLQGLGLGLGFNFVGERQGDLANSFEADSYFLTNAAIFYRQEKFQLRLNLDNLFDVDYIEALGNNRVRGIYPGDPFTIRGSVSIEF